LYINTFEGVVTFVTIVTRFLKNIIFNWGEYTFRISNGRKDFSKLFIGQLIFG